MVAQAEVADPNPAAVGAWWPADRLFATVPPPLQRVSFSLRAIGALVGLVVLRALVYVALGPQLILDDWSILASIEVNGVGEAAPTLQWGRPVAWLVDTVIYGAVGPHPLVLFAVVTVLNAGAAVLLYLVLSRFFRSTTALLVAGVWVLAANHNTLTVWTATAPTVVALLLLLGGILALTNGRWVVAGACLALSVLSYELTAPAALAAVVLLPSSRPLGLKHRVVMGGLVLLATGWVALDPLTDPRWDVPGLPLLWRALFSDGLLGTAGGPTRLVHYLGDLVLVGVLVAVVAWLVGQRDREDGPVLVLWGIGVIALGSLALLNLGLGQEGIGMQDRLLALSSVGAAMILVGVLQLVWRHLRAAALVVGVALVLALAAGQFVSLRSWARAGEDAVALHRFVAAIATPDVDAPVDVTVGSETREHNGVIGLSEDTGSAPASYLLRFGEGAGRLRMVTSPSEFVAVVPGERMLEWQWIDSAAVLDQGVGFVAAVTVPGPGQAIVYGWAEDGGADGDPVEIAFTVDGEEVERAPADVERADIAQALGRPDPAHAFEQLLEVPAGTHTVCARTVGEGAVSLGCAEVDVQAGGLPVGAVESAQVVSPGTIEVRGWAADPSAGDEPIEVEVTVGPVTQTAVADQPRPDIEDALGFPGGPDHGFVTQVAVGAGNYTVCVVAQNAGEGRDQPLGTCTAITVP